MGDFTLNKLWDLRGSLDEAVVNGDYAKLPQIEEEYKELVKSEKDFSYAFMGIGYNYGASDDFARRVHNNYNIDTILMNIRNYKSKYIGKKDDVSLKFKNHNKEPFLAGDIWIMRGMYDKFVQQANIKDVDWVGQQNMILGKAIIERLDFLVGKSRWISGWGSGKNWQAQIRTILDEVKGTYESLYGKEQPRLDYSSLLDDYMER